jgi:alkanesulfonate monooxygenase SsuD/methylene tetrahydromethanopterin reductase-like flavin-dependent oxidoreductase (luciferase family)
MTLADPARELEQRGFESVWSGEHSHIPAAMKTPFSATAGSSGTISKRWTRS